MNRWEGRVALVTGASVGIGAAICTSLVTAGMKVVGAARDVEKIETLANVLKDKPGLLTAVKCDLTRDSDVIDLFKVIREKHGRLDVCINNAGYAANISLLDGTPSEWRGMLDVNVVALCLCTRESVALMREKDIDDGQIIHISSMAGHQIGPNKFYSCTKFAVRALTEGLRQELRELKTNIRISEISPGMVKTEFIPRMKNLPHEEAYASFTHKILEAKDIADSVVYILSAPPHVQIHDILMRPTEQIA